jgi:membrane protein implicated in regulation of membrane protease activity
MTIFWITVVAFELLALLLAMAWWKGRSKVH